MHDYVSTQEQSRREAGPATHAPHQGKSPYKAVKSFAHEGWEAVTMGMKAETVLYQIPIWHSSKIE